jgi:hypothetical protein
MFTGHPRPNMRLMTSNGKFGDEPAESTPNNGSGVPRVLRYSSLGPRACGLTGRAPTMKTPDDGTKPVGTATAANCVNAM